MIVADVAENLRKVEPMDRIFKEKPNFHDRILEELSDAIEADL